MITEKNLFEKGMFITIHSGSYEGRKKLSPDQLKDLPQEIVRGVHDLFDKEFKILIREIKSFDAVSRNMVKKKSVPFPFGVVCSLYFIGTNQIDEIIELLDGRMKERVALIDTAVENYEAAIETFAAKYPDYYSLAKDRYPTKGRFAKRFYFNYQFIKIAAPDKSPMITAEQYKREKEKFRETIEEMKKEVVATIYQSLLDMTTRLKEQCAGGKPNQATLNGLNNFLSQIDGIYSEFIDRDDLKAAIGKVKAQLLGVTAQSFRGSEELKDEWAKQIKGIVNEFKALPDIPLKRAIDF